MTDYQNFHLNDISSGKSKFRKFIYFLGDSEELGYLRKYHSNSFLLFMYLVERTAIRKEEEKDGLKIGQSYLPDTNPNVCGINIKKSYESAVEFLVTRGHLKIYLRQKDPLRRKVRIVSTSICNIPLSIRDQEEI